MKPTIPPEFFSIQFFQARNTYETILFVFFKKKIKLTVDFDMSQIMNRPVIFAINLLTSKLIELQIEMMDLLEREMNFIN